MYRTLLDEALGTVQPDGDYTVDSLSDRITHAIHYAANVSLPKSKFNKYSKPYWTRDVKAAHCKSRQMRTIWISNGRPRGREHPSFRSYKQAKAQFRKVQRMESDKYMNKVYTYLDELDYRLLWKLLRNRKSTRSYTCTEITANGRLQTSPEEVADGFATYYRDIFNDTWQDDEESHISVSNITTMVNRMAQSTELKYGEVFKSPITIWEITEIQKTLKRRSTRF